MSSLLLSVVGIIYLAVACDYFNKGKAGMGLAFIAYAVANLGFIVANLRRE